MRRRDVLFLLTGIAAYPRRAHGQQHGPVSVPVLLLVAEVRPRANFDGLRREIARLGYIEGESILIREYIGRLGELGTELARQKVDVIFASSPASVRAVRESTTTIPIVAYDLESDPLRSGYIRTFAQPSGNLTGIFLDQPELAGKWLQLLREVAPGLSNAAVIWDAETGTSQLDAARAAAQRLGIQLQVVPLSPDLDGLFNAIKAGQAQGLILLSSPKAQQFAEQVVEFARHARLPTTSMFREFTKQGGLLSYGPDFVAMRSRAAAMIDRILRGEGGTSARGPGSLTIRGPSTST